MSKYQISYTVQSYKPQDVLLIGAVHKSDVGENTLDFQQLTILDYLRCRIITPSSRALERYKNSKYMENFKVENMKCHENQIFVKTKQLFSYMYVRKRIPKE